jgi:putative (di)nucleoside polyphosphate hydrolase
MPQGGIDDGEDPMECARREMAEETSVTSMEFLAEAPRWYNYDLPQHLIGKSWKGRYRGQTQKWFAFRFTGDDSEVNLAPPGHKQEFDEWKWATMDEALSLIVPFKKPVYEQVMQAFRHLTTA